MRRHVFVGVALAATLSILATTAVATPLGPQPIVDLQGQGLTIAEDGVGLRDLGTSTRSLSVTIGGPVQEAFLYWAGRETTGCSDGACFQSPNVQPYGDQELVFEGSATTGSIVGSELDSIGYMADVTGIVQAKGTGTQTFSISDGDLFNNLDRLNGAGLIVVYTEPSDGTSYRVMIVDGLDFAHRNRTTFPSPESAITSPVTFSFDSAATDRGAQLTLFTGDGDAARPDRVDISNNASILDSVDETDGDSWDTDIHSIVVPASVTTTTVEVVSAATGTAEPDSMMWVLAALRVPLPASGGTGGGGTGGGGTGGGGSGGGGSGGGGETGGEPGTGGESGEVTLHERWITLSSRHRDGLLVLRGLVRATDGYEFCHQNVDVTIAFRRPGFSWSFLTDVETGPGGRYRTLVTDRRARYRAFVDAIASPDGSHTCGAAQSAVLIHRHR